MPNLTLSLFAFLSLGLSGAIFGFFYAFFCTVMWGLDTTAPSTAIEAMKGINAVVRNAAFAPIFFGTPVALLVTALLAVLAQQRGMAVWFGAAAAIYLFGALVVTVSGNVPLNEMLATANPNADEAGALWAQYSADWQRLNLIRTVFAGISLICVGAGLLALGRASPV